MSSSTSVSRSVSSRAGVSVKKGASADVGEETASSRKSQIDVALIQELHAYDRHCRQQNDVSSTNVVQRQRLYEIRLALMQQVHFQSLSIENLRGIQQNKQDKISELEFETRHANDYLEKLYVTMSTERDEQSQQHESEITTLRSEIQQAYRFNQEMEQYQRDKPVLLARLSALKKAVVHEHASLANNIKMYETRFELEIAALKREMTQKVKEAKQWQIKSTDECMHPVARKAMGRNLHRIVELEYLSVYFDRTRMQNHTLVGKTARVAKRTQAIERELSRSASRCQWLKKVCENFSKKKNQVVIELNDAQTVYKSTKDYLRQQRKGVDSVVKRGQQRNEQLRSLLQKDDDNDDAMNKSEILSEKQIDTYMHTQPGKPLQPSTQLGLTKADQGNVVLKYGKSHSVVQEQNDKIERNENDIVHTIQLLDTSSENEDGFDQNLHQQQTPKQQQPNIPGSSGSEISIDDFHDSQQVSEYYNNTLLLKLGHTGQPPSVMHFGKGRVRSADFGILLSRMRKEMTRVDENYETDGEEPQPVEEEEETRKETELASSNVVLNRPTITENNEHILTESSSSATPAGLLPSLITSITSTLVFPDAVAEHKRANLAKNAQEAIQKKQTGLQPLPTIQGDQPVRRKVDHSHVAAKVHDNVLPLSLRALSNKLSLLREELRGAQSNTVLANEARADAMARYEDLVKNVPTHTRIMLECLYSAHKRIQGVPDDDPLRPPEDQLVTPPNAFLKDLKMEEVYNDTTTPRLVPELLHIATMDRDDRWKLMDEWFLNMSNAVQKQ